MDEATRYIDEALFGKDWTRNLSSAEGLDERQEQMKRIRNLPICLLALDASKVTDVFVAGLNTVTESLPDLSPATVATEQGASSQFKQGLGDEALTELAAVVGKLDVVFNKLKVPLHLLFPFLVALCKQDETTVRERAVLSLHHLAPQCSGEQIASHLAAAVLTMAHSSQVGPPNFSPANVSSCSLLAPVYKIMHAKCPTLAIKIEVNGVELSGMPKILEEIIVAYRDLFNNSDYMVRSALASSLEKAVEAFGDKFASFEEQLNSFVDPNPPERSAGGPSGGGESVRVRALKCAGKIFSVLQFNPKAGLGKLYLDAQKDTSWRVRIAVAESLGAVAHSISLKRSEANAKEDASAHDSLKEAFLTLLSDNESEVKTRAATQIALVAEKLGADWAHERLANALWEMVHPEEAPMRVELAGTLMELAKPLGLQRSKAFFMDKGVLKELLEDNTNNLRLVVMEKLDAFLDVMEDNKEVVADIHEKIHELCTYSCWRVRWAAMRIYPTIAKMVSVEELMAKYSTNFLKLAVDNCDLIRTDWVDVVSEMAGEYQKKGETYLKNVPGSPMHILFDKTSGNSTHKSYQQRGVVLDAAAKWVDIMDPTDITTIFLPEFQTMLGDKVPNLRLQAGRRAGDLLANPKVGTKAKELLGELIKDMVSDGDKDVAECMAALAQKYFP